MEVRYVLIGGHYRTSLNFTLDSLSAAREALGKLAKAGRTMATNMGDDTALDAPGFGPFQAAWDRLNDDLNTPAALGGLFIGLREAVQLTGKDAAAALAGFNRLLHALGLTLPAEVHTVSTAIPQSIQDLAESRWQARLAKNWALSDSLRAELAAHGWMVKDSKDAYTIEANSPD
jgi:cysteinyl-tRNA synthetase